MHLSIIQCFNLAVARLHVSGIQDALDLPTFRPVPVVQRPPRHPALIRADLDFFLVFLQRRAAGRPCIEQLLYFFPLSSSPHTRHPNLQTRGNIVKQPRKGSEESCMLLQATLPKLTSPPTRFRYKTKNCMALLTPAIHQDCLSESFLGEAQVTEGGGTDIARPSIHTPMMHQTRARLSTQNHTPNPQN